MRSAFPTFSNQTAARWHSLVSDGKRNDGTINFFPTRPADLEHVVVTDYLHFIAHRARPRLSHPAVLIRQLLTPLPNLVDPIW